MTILKRFLYRTLAGAILSMTPLAASAFSPPADLPEAREICDNADLMPIEGIWTYPNDEVSVLVYRDEDKRGTWNIYVVEAADCSLKAGMKLGELQASADPDKFNLKLFTTVKNGLPSVPREAIATFSSSKEALSIKKKSTISLRLNPTRLLPSFWRLININLKSGESAPEGMIKAYPSYDGNGSTKRAPRYL